MKNWCVIPARGGSVRIPGKNIKLFHGKPIIQYSIECARASGLFEGRIFVSTDTSDIAYVAHVNNADGFWRSADDGTRGTFEVVRSAVHRLVEEDDFVCCLYPTAPLLCPADLDSALCMLGTFNVWHVVAIGAEPLRDAGAFYWSRAKAVTPYWEVSTLGYVLPENRVCDINTPEDWARAERMYAELHA